MEVEYLYSAILAASFLKYSSFRDGELPELLGLTSGSLQKYSEGVRSIPCRVRKFCQRATVSAVAFGVSGPASDCPSHSASREPLIATTNLSAVGERAKHHNILRFEPWRMMGLMGSKLKPSDEYTAFSDALRRVLQVTPTELKARIEAAREARTLRRTERRKLLARRAATRAKRASGHAASGKD
jgi:hypothetical protein